MPDTLPLELLRVDRQLEALTPMFVRWFEDGYDLFE